MTTQALLIQNLQSTMVELQNAYIAVQVANTNSGNLVTPATVTAIQTAITTAQNAVNALVPVFNGNN